MLSQMSSFNRNASARGTAAATAAVIDYERQFQEDLERAQALSLESLALEKFRLQKQQTQYTSTASSSVPNSSSSNSVVSENDGCSGDR